ncbi:MAG: MG2 domain-containing protein, partial [Verrucomicrobia bacterium]|nr:MG2 domain-containing protein [Verrucomicrobiota bacterium]
MTMNSAQAASRPALWKQVDEAVNKGLPKTAITNLDQIIPAALQEKAYGEAAKAIARKIVLEGNIQGNKPEEKITRMEAEIAKAPKEIVPLLNTIRAAWYWQYFQQNRWRFMQRTATAAAPGQDFTTWDLARLFAEIDKVFTLAMSAADLKMPVSMFDELLQKGSLPDAYRPTLYDFIAQEALKFYSSGEQGAAKPEDAFEVSADSPVLGSVENFLAWKPEATQTDSPALKAIRLYQDLLRFHQKDKDPTAFIDVDLARLAYGHNVAFGENKIARYKAALKAFVDQWADHEVSAVALHHWAQVVKGEGDWVEARTLAQRGQNAHRDSPGGRMCHNLIQEIEAKSASITTERVWNKPWPKIAVRYRNVTEIHFRAVAWDWNDFLAKQHARPEWLNDKERKELFTRPKALEWSAKLPPTSDFKEHTEMLPAPDKLKPGHYFIVASHNPDFSDTENQVSYTDIWVSDLALVVITRNGNVEGWVLEAISGDPIPQAEVVAWYLDNNGNRQQNGAPQLTDANGWFSFTPDNHRPLLLRARANGQEMGSQQEYSSWETPQELPDDRVFFFTDRALYRPGQTIQYKGICLHVNRQKDDYQVVAGRRLECIFSDPNGKEVAKQSCVTTDYGSFSGSFTAPRDRLMGRYTMSVREGVHGETAINVEEYKRPKFQVTLDAPKAAPRLGDKVSVQGKAEAYTGAAVDGAEVKWRVVREVRWPQYWCDWGWSRGTYRPSESQEIGHGTATTRSDGAFVIAFMTRPDPKVDEKSEATFHFRIYADVTDSAGETRSADRSVNVGFVALSVRVEAEEWQTDDKAVELKLQTTTLDGEAQVAEGSLKIYQLKAPPTVQRPSLVDYQNSPDDRIMTEDGGQSNPVNWPLGDIALEKGWTTGP